MLGLAMNRAPAVASSRWNGNRVIKPLLGLLIQILGELLQFALLGITLAVIRL